MLSVHKISHVIKTKPAKNIVEDERSSRTEARDHHNQEFPLRPSSNYRGVHFFALNFRGKKKGEE